ncbi:phosphoglycerate mutase [Azospirillum sp. TSH7]|uniref:histidine phosphatase family protein n=1 Tax=unclassified Azospirillum TaxID=2630922 RepID=UPI000D60B503|nr:MULTISPECIES: histidine phosphatase family protein [unclassified Azospirillum]PWC64320.1 phosphoglycerate mutase [Azospirillum sp. TSH7]PWC70869.1 phosphoglycerate mutase [Azospirillum sp. TSH20]
MTDRFHFVRHGETEDNRRGVRCGGDRDVPLTDRGIEQARWEAERFRQSGRPCGLVIVGPLQRTAVTGAVFAETLGVPLLRRDWLRERSLGEWNGLAIDLTRPWFAAGETPPGGESEGAFAARVLDGVDELANGPAGLLARRPLLVGSKGIGRILLHRLAGRPGVELGNCEVMAFTRLSAPPGGPGWWRCDPVERPLEARAGACCPA